MPISKRIRQEVVLTMPCSLADLNEFLRQVGQDAAADLGKQAMRHLQVETDGDVLSVEWDHDSAAGPNRARPAQSDQVPAKDETEGPAPVTVTDAPAIPVRPSTPPQGRDPADEDHHDIDEGEERSDSPEDDDPAEGGIP